MLLIVLIWLMLFLPIIGVLLMIVGGFGWYFGWHAWPWLVAIGIALLVVGVLILRWTSQNLDIS